MTELNIKTTFSVFEDITETPKNIQDLMQNAVEARKKAYAPYSKFKVGVALVLENGTIVIGSNQENAAYPSGLCAERVAIYHAGAMYPDQKIISIAKSSSKIIHLPPLEEGDMTRRCPDTAKMKTILGRDLISLEDGIVKLIKHYLDYYLFS